MRKLIHVAAAVILDHRGHILLAQRPDDKHQGGLWEFPGGKVEPNEPVVEALARELDEELGIQLTHAQPLIRIPHHYPDKSVLLDVYTVDAFSGEPFGREGQPVRWVAPADLQAYEFPAANKPIVTAALLADRLMITGPGNDQAEYLSCFERAVAQHELSLVMLRAPHLDTGDYADLAQAMMAKARQQGVTLVLNCPLDQANQLEADGLHLSSARLRELQHRDQFNGRWLGASCHDAEELAIAMEKGVDYVTLSPVLPTTSHPETPAMGWEQFSALVADLPIPVFALGGQRASDLAQARACGAQGIAAISAWWQQQ